MSYKVGDYVECVTSSTSALTLGKIYEVLGHSAYVTIKVVNDRGEEGTYYESRFKVHALRKELI